MAEEKTKEVLELQVPSTLKHLIEALVFAAKEPLTFKQMKDIYEGDGPQSYLRQLDPEEVEASVNELNAEYVRAEKPYRIVRIAGGYQFATLPLYADWIGRLYKEQGRRKLSQSGLESLAIIAYKQPVTKSDIESIRGVNCDYVLKTLLEKELVTIVGRAHAPGRPLLYGTTREFLRHFGLNEITDLPRPREIEEILGESQFETERRMLESQAGAEKMKQEEPDFKSRLPHIPKKKPELDSAVEIRSKDNPRELKTVKPSDEAVADERRESSTTELQTDVPAMIAPIEDQVSPATPSGVEVPVTADPEKIEDEYAEAQTLSEISASPDHVEPEQESVLTVLAGEVSISEPPITRPETVNTSAQVDEPRPDSIPVHEPSVEVHQEQAAASVLDQSVANKSKWVTWKERVRGFIRKIFG